ncbi:PhoU domain-containing protein [Amycolatopsis sp. FDAARGOS 1241]|uniref:phosphate signaling complex PhoU family protein n=1 Tax=Amycolatopsis sp. FDAARGOS 1241 TaxID=2778070 RepID=UPI001951547E|nr:PhoU domain-containing protein [Amycolatopsis sp. FDAARGOS 1241]QRP44758.1 phosphate transport system regulatory protein PhoU [Amycolatopsis sp. FDAARGOS 1241]
MRDTFHGELAQLGGELSEMCAFSTQAMREATRALLTADLLLAEQVLSGDAELDWRRAECEEHAQALLALQAPVAHELRSVLAAVYSADKIERMGDLAAHIAGIARFHHPHHAVPAELEEMFSVLGELTAAMADRLTELLAAPVEGMHAELENADQAVDDLHARVLGLITTPTWHDGPAVASNAALLARFYERFGDQVVSVAKRLEFAATGSLPA